VDKLTLHLYKAMGIIKENEYGYQASFEDIQGLGGKGQEGHWTDPNVNIHDWHKQAVKNRHIPDVPEYWERLRSHLVDQAQTKLDSDEGMSPFDYEVAARAGLGDDSMTEHMHRQLVNSNQEFMNDPRGWNKKFKEIGGLHAMRRLFEPSFGEGYRG